MPPNPDRIAADLREQIADGRLPQGAQLPTQYELVSRYGTTRAVVRAALDELILDGLVEARRPIGTFVREQHLHPYRLDDGAGATALSAQFGQYVSQLAQSAAGVTDSDVTVAVVPSPALVAEQLELPAGGDVVRRANVLTIDGRPHQSSAAYYPLDLVRHSPIARLGQLPDGDEPELETLGLIESRRASSVTVRMPTPEERLLLRLPVAGVPVAIHVATSYTAGERPIRCTITVLPGDRHVLVCEQTRDLAGH